MIEVLSVDLLKDPKFAEIVNSCQIVIKKFVSEAADQNIIRCHYTLDYAWIIYRFMELCKPNVRMDQLKVLDAGSGMGTFPICLGSRGVELYLVDRRNCASHWKDLEVKSGMKLSFYQADLKSLPFEKDFFDFVVSASSLEHNTFEGAERITLELFRVLKPEGALIATLVACAEPHVWETGKKKDPIVALYTDTELKKTFLGSGFKLYSDFNNFSELDRIWKGVSKFYGQGYLKRYTPIGIILIKPRREE